MIHIANLQRHLPVPQAKVRRLVARILRGEKAGDITLSFAFLDNREIRKVNRHFLRHDYATDVISFLLDDRNLSGEVVISAEYARREAKRRAIPAEEELLRYVAHGVLHLLGYDDRTPSQRKLMWSRQERYLRNS